MKAPAFRVQELYESGFSQKEISEMLNCSRSLIDKTMRCHNIKARDFISACRNRVHVNESTCQSLTNDYMSGIPLPNILNKYEISEKVFRRVIGTNRRTISESNKMVTQRRKHDLNQFQLDLIYGTLLGDASLTLSGHSIIYSTIHCDRQRGYTDHIRTCIGHGSCSTIIQKSGFAPGALYHSYKYRNKGSLQEIWDVVMVNGKKTVNPKWIENLTVKALAYWFMDDGSSVRIGDKKKYIRVTFATYSFSFVEVSLLRDKLLEFGLNTTIDHSPNTRHGRGLSIRLSQTDSDKFMEMVSPTIQTIDCMKYKLKYRQGFFQCKE